MSLRRLAAPFLLLAHWCCQSLATRRLMVELRESFDDRATAHSGDHSIVLRGSTRMEHQKAIGFLSKESDMIAWPDELLPGDLFVDIVANNERSQSLSVVTHQRPNFMTSRASFMILASFGMLKDISCSIFRLAAFAPTVIPPAEWATIPWVSVAR